MIMARPFKFYTASNIIRPNLASRDFECNSGLFGLPSQERVLAHLSKHKELYILWSTLLQSLSRSRLPLTRAAMSLRPRTTTRGDARRRSYKAWVDAGEARRRREAYLLDLRRSKRHGDLLKRRRRRHDDDDEDHDSASPPLSPRHPEPRDHAAPDPPSPSSSPPPPPAAAAEGDDDAGDSEVLPFRSPTRVASCFGYCVVDGVLIRV